MSAATNDFVGATALGIYLSVPFCKAKCTFCNFASDVFGLGSGAPSPAHSAAHSMDRYVAHLRREIRNARTSARSLEAHLPDTVDTLYFGGGTPSLLSPAHLNGIFVDLRNSFHLAPNAEITVECAPGQLSNATLDELLRQGVNRISFGVQSFIDRETSAVGRLHTRAHCLDELARMQSHGLDDLSLDLIAGLPHQTEASWRASLTDAINTGAPHLSVYMLEIDEDSRLGHELLTGGSRYHAEAAPTDDESASFYEIACEVLATAGLAQYEISNFARPGHQSRHNLKYWHREPYLGFGLDAHSMLQTPTGAVRFANPSDMDLYLAASNLASADPFPIHAPLSHAPAKRDRQTIDEVAAFEEALFLGLRLNAGVNLSILEAEFGTPIFNRIAPALTETVSFGLLEREGNLIRLTPRGRMLSNEAFSRLLLSAA